MKVFQRYAYFIEWHENISVQLWLASSKVQIYKSTVYERCSIRSRPKVDADVLYSCNLVRVHQLMNIL